MSKPYLTIGIPVYHDLIGLQQTLMDLVLHHDYSDVEIVVVNNDPGGPEAKDTAKFVQGLHGRCIDLAERGTAPARNKIFEEATGEVIVVEDSHLELPLTTLPAIRRYFHKHPESLDIVTGPLFHKYLRRPEEGEGLAIQATHYADQFRGDMWGTWRLALQCPCRAYHIDVEAWIDPQWQEGMQIDSGGSIIAAPASARVPQARYYGAVMGRPHVTHCPACGREIPPGPYQGHVRRLQADGWLRRGWNPDDTEPFEIPGLGLGMFACRKDAWVGFPKEMRGFGGGELHLHEAFRRQGGKAMCLPDAPWWHRFLRNSQDGETPPYPNPWWQTMRNYVLWRQALDMSLEPVEKHFVEHGEKRSVISRPDWEYLIEDPVGRVNPPAPSASISRNAGAVVQIEPQISPLDAVYSRAVIARNDVNEHLPTVRKLAEQVQRVATLSKRPQWDAGIVPAKPQMYVHYCSQGPGPMQQQLGAQHEYRFTKVNDYLAPEPVDVDLLLIDTIHTGEQFRQELDRWAPHVSKWIVRSSAAAFAEKGEKGGEGLMTAAESWCEQNPKWKPVYASNKQRGLVVLGCDPRERTLLRGVGFHLSRLYKSIDINPPANCSCRALAEKMNQLGPAGCRGHFDELIVAMEENAQKYGWNDKLHAGVKAIKTGLAFRINPLKPLHSCLKIAIERAEEDDRAWGAQMASQQAAEQLVEVPA